MRSTSKVIHFVLKVRKTAPRVCPPWHDAWQVCRTALGIRTVASYGWYVALLSFDILETLSFLMCVPLAALHMSVSLLRKYCFSCPPALEIYIFGCYVHSRFHVNDVFCEYGLSAVLALVSVRVVTS